MKLDLKPAYFPVNPAPSSYAVISAARAGGGDLAGLVQAFPRAVWANGRNIAEDEVVKQIYRNLEEMGMANQWDSDHRSNCCLLYCK